MDVLRVSALSKSTAVAGAIARGYLALEGYDIICIPAFANISIDDQERTAIKFIVEPR
jgi:stage V sporulation protein S